MLRCFPLSMLDQKWLMGRWSVVFCMCMVWVCSPRPSGFIIGRTMYLPGFGTGIPFGPAMMFAVCAMVSLLNIHWCFVLVVCQASCSQ